MLDQPLSSNSFYDALGNFCSLGNSASLNVVQGNPVAVTSSYNSSTGAQFSQTLIDFSATAVANYSFTFPDSTDPTGTTYDVRWAVIITGSTSRVTSKRFILGVRQLGGNGFLPPVTLDTVVER
jgi:hypothetical protein